VDMGVEPHVLTSALDVVVGCSLVRTLCSSCSGRGCITCGDTGYAGRTGVFELMVMTRASRDAVLRRADADSVARSAAWIPEGGAWAAGQGKVDVGITTSAELERALGMGRPATGELEVRADVVERLSEL
jgi:general secretion pathway protein E